MPKGQDELTVNPEHWEPPRLLRVPEVQSLLAVSRGTVYNMMSSGELERVKVGRSTRISRSSIAEWLRKNSGSTRNS